MGNPSAKNTELSTVRAKKNLRQCVGCRNECCKEELLRFVYIPTEDEKGKRLVFDAYQRLPGRGAYLHLSKECMELALKSGFKRSFKESLECPNREELLSQLFVGVCRKIEGIVRAGYKCSDSYVGEMAISEAMKRDALSIVFIAADAGQATRQKYERNAERKEIKVCAEFFTRQKLGELMGKPSVSLIGFGGQIGRTLIQQTLRMEELKTMKLESASLKE